MTNTQFGLFILAVIAILIMVEKDISNVVAGIALTIVKVKEFGGASGINRFKAWADNFTVETLNSNKDVKDFVETMKRYCRYSMRTIDVTLLLFAIASFI